MEDSPYIALKRSLSSVPVKVLNCSSRMILSQNLDVKLVLPSKEGHARDYRGLAELMGFQYNDTKRFERYDDPTMKILESWETHPDSTLDKLITYLEEMERHDVIKELMPSLERDAKTYLKNQELQDIPIQVPEVTSCPVGIRTERELQAITRGGCTYYDAYVSYADEDCEFVRALADDLESPEIGFKLFIRGRDMLAGCAELDTNIELIKNRCRLMLIILSPNFLKSPACEFQASFAASLAIEQRHRMLIPVVLAPCEIPSILKYVSKIDFTRPDIQDWVWDKLIKSLLPEDRISSFSSERSSFQRALKAGSTNNRPVITFPQTIKHLPNSANNIVPAVSPDTSIVPVENALNNSTAIPSKVTAAKKWKFQLSSHFKRVRKISSSAYNSTVSNSSSSNATSGFHSQSSNSLESSIGRFSDDTSV